MPKSESKKKEIIRWMINCDNPTPLAFYRFVKPNHHNRADEKYRNALNSAKECNPKNREIQKKLTEMRKKFDEGEFRQDWEIWIQEKRATQVHRSIQETNENVHKKFNSLVESQSVIVKQVEEKDKERNEKRSQIDNGSDDVAVAVELAKKKSKTDELFEDMRKRNIYMLCDPFRKLSQIDAEDRFESIVRGTFVDIELPIDIKEYLRCLLSGDIESALSEVEKPLKKGVQPLMLWTREVCRHFLFYFYYDGLQIDSDEKTWSNQTVYRILDLFSMFFRNLTSGIAFGEIVNDAHKDRVYNINANQKPSNSRRGDKNDAVLYQDGNATIIYEQSFGPTEFDSTHYMGDITKLARNGVDDLNYHFLQYSKSTVTTAKKLKSIGIHGYKYFISIYLTDLIRMKTYRIYEIFKCKIPTSYTDRWLLANIVMIGVYLELLLTTRRSVKEDMGMEDTIIDHGFYHVRDWMVIPDNTPENKRTK
ncbi:13614_t:CDS:2 [Acaulospora morrowiae]|uniref:13614_t:CDS:1 n=1 Tax=Acaulospora morrowiae TaxID=94023 RepID=A0A9N8ZEV0_9GLOM|nr:13614_t:CDS:2 [Acaulospora morrowiae]